MFYFSAVFLHRLQAINWLCLLKLSRRASSLHLLLLYDAHYFPYMSYCSRAIIYQRSWPLADHTYLMKETLFSFDVTDNQNILMSLWDSEWWWDKTERVGNILYLCTKVELMRFSGILLYFFLPKCRYNNKLHLDADILTQVLNAK